MASALPARLPTSGSALTVPDAAADPLPAPLGRDDGVAAWLAVPVDVRAGRGALLLARAGQPAHDLSGLDPRAALGLARHAATVLDLAADHDALRGEARCGAGGRDVRPAHRRRQPPRLGRRAAPRPRAGRRRDAGLGGGDRPRRPEAGERHRGPRGRRRAHRRGGPRPAGRRARRASTSWPGSAATSSRWCCPASAPRPR
ncbi:hypothetical protein GCM10025868_11620 [Angustibacter aerolatus]|uniref:GAF domain-containing protein n=1 Tax=Angustibacter aerolatus TaxID=1162965 RepID=A0ABQ6JDQ0_9ACTN|nr:hypothetical protein GCM10025868_11620 [Angustibacter aerolatus]